MKASIYQQSIYQDIIETKDNIAISATAGCLGINTPIQMYDGSIKLVQDIIVGDKIMGPDFICRDVVNVATGNSILYKIIPEYGDSWICNDTHILTVWHNGWKQLRDIQINLLVYFLQGGYNVKVKESHSQLYQLQKNIQGNDPTRSNFLIEELGLGDWYGFTVNKDHRFLLSDGTITHNSGKTTTLIEALKLVPKEDKTIFLSFSNTIVNELKDRVPTHIKATTLHSQGFGIIRANNRNKTIEVNNNIYFKLAIELFENKKIKDSLRSAFEIQQISEFIRMTMTSLDYDSINHMCMLYGLSGGTDNINKSIKVMQKRNSRASCSVDFADMIYWPATKNYHIDKYKYVMVDECFPGETLIKTNQGKLKIKDIHKRIKGGDVTIKAYSYNEEQDIFEYKQVSNSWNRGTKLTIQFVVGGCRKIECTPNHKFLTPNGWIEAAELKIGSAIFCRNTGVTNAEIVLVTGLTNKTREVEVFDLEVEDNHNFLICKDINVSSNIRTQHVDGLELVAHNCQDLNKSQHALIEKLIAPGGRLISVGDEFQSIYGFAGSSVESFRDIMDRPFTLIKPLSICYRCDINIVKAAQVINPAIEYNPNNELGIVRYGEISEITVKDMVICRNTLPLVITLFNLISRGIRAHIIGRDIEKGLLHLVDFNQTNITFTQLNVMLEQKKDKLAAELKEKGVKRVEYNTRYINMCDQIQIIHIISKQVPNPSHITNKIKEIFVQQVVGCKLMTIHKSKGLENERVFLIQRYEGKVLLPSPYATLDQELQQEKHLDFVAHTRAKKELVLIKNVESKI